MILTWHQSLVPLFLFSVAKHGHFAYLVWHLFLLKPKPYLYPMVQRRFVTPNKVGWRIFCAVLQPIRFPSNCHQMALWVSTSYAFFCYYSIVPKIAPHTIPGACLENIFATTHAYRISHLLALGTNKSTTVLADMCTISYLLTPET